MWARWIEALEFLAIGGQAIGLAVLLGGGAMCARHYLWDHPLGHRGCIVCDLGVGWLFSLGLLMLVCVLLGLWRAVVLRRLG